MPKWILLILPFAIVASLAAAACGGGSKKTVTVGDTKIQTDNKLPADFPSDFPIYSPADFRGALSSTQQGQTGFAATWESGDGVDKVKSYYGDQLGGTSNWTRDSATDTGAGAFYSFHKKSDAKKMGILTIATANGKTSFVVFVGTTPNAGSDGGSNSSSSSASSSASSSSSSGSTADATANSSSSTAPGGSATTAAELPAEATLSDDFPKDRVPLPSGSRVTSATSVSSGGLKNAFVEVYVKDTPANVSSYFKTELPKHGWTSSVTSEADGISYLQYAGASGSSDAVAIAVEQSDTPGYAKATITVSAAGG